MRPTLNRLLCIVGWHRWKEVLVLEFVYPSGLTATLHDDVCQHCDKMRHADNTEYVLRMMLSRAGPNDVVRQFYPK